MTVVGREDLVCEPWFKDHTGRLDGHPHILAWLPGALGSPGIPLGVTTFGQSGTRAELYEEFQIDVGSIATACLALLLR
jgi:pyruvate dehydrogenase E1 component